MDGIENLNKIHEVPEKADQILFSDNTISFNYLDESDETYLGYYYCWKEWLELFLKPYNRVYFHKK